MTTSPSWVNYNQGPCVEPRRDAKGHHTRIATDTTHKEGTK